MIFDPIQIEVWRNLFESIPDEMGATLEHTAYSPNIKERRDHSCALFDARGLLIAQAAHIPVHLGAMPLMMHKLFKLIPWKSGEMWICNDPAIGGTHLPDFTLIAPVFLGEVQDELVGFVANRAHHADIGGMSPGSLPLSHELCQEGLILPPTRIVLDWKPDKNIINLICRNSRTSEERLGDIAAQIGANEIGVRRFKELITDHGITVVSERIDEANRYTGHVVRQFLGNHPNGIWTATDYMETDGLGEVNLPITVQVTINGEEIHFDFAGTGAQSTGSINATEAVTLSAVYYVVRCLLDVDIPMNSALHDCIKVTAPFGTLVNASRNAAVAAGNVETSQRIVDVILQSLASTFPEKIPACSQGTMNNVTIGGFDLIRNRPFAYYETIGGGCGASQNKDGASAVHSHMTNTRNTPIEALEMHYPLRILQYRIRRGSGGIGTHCGGDGIVREVEILQPAVVTVITERRNSSPSGLNGAEPGLTGSNIVVRLGQFSNLESKDSIHVVTGDCLTIETPGGGGWGANKK